MYRMDGVACIVWGHNIACRVPPGAGSHMLVSCFAIGTYTSLFSCRSGLCAPSGSGMPSVSKSTIGGLIVYNTHFRRWHSTHPMNVLHRGHLISMYCVSGRSGCRFQQLGHMNSFHSASSTLTACAYAEMQCGHLGMYMWHDVWQGPVITPNLNRSKWTVPIGRFPMYPGRWL